MCGRVQEEGWLGTAVVEYVDVPSPQVGLCAKIDQGVQ